MATVNYAEYLEAAEVTEVDGEVGLRKIIGDLSPELTADVAREIDFWLTVFDECDNVGTFRQLQFVRCAIDRYGKDALWALARAITTEERAKQDMAA